MIGVQAAAAGIADTQGGRHRHGASTRAWPPSGSGSRPRTPSRARWPAQKVTLDQVRNDAAAADDGQQAARSRKSGRRPPSRRRRSRRSTRRIPRRSRSPTQVRASHILITVPQDADAAVKAEALAKATSVLKSARGGKGFRRTGQGVLAGSRLRRARRRSRILRRRADGAAVQRCGVQAETGNNQRRRRDAVRLSHHQGDREAAGRGR